MAVYQSGLPSHVSQNTKSITASIVICSRKDALILQVILGPFRSSSFLLGLPDR